MRLFKGLDFILIKVEAVLPVKTPQQVAFA